MPLIKNLGIGTIRNLICDSLIGSVFLFMDVSPYRKSHGLVIPDAFIAGTALEENLKLVTSNVRYFEMISGVPIQKPY